MYRRAVQHRLAVDAAAAVGVENIHPVAVADGAEVNNHRDALAVGLQGRRLSSHRFGQSSLRWYTASPSHDKSAQPEA
jgi:hypothetical protein